MKNLQESYYKLMYERDYLKQAFENACDVFFNDTRFSSDPTFIAQEEQRLQAQEVALNEVLLRMEAIRKQVCKEEFSLWGKELRARIWGRETGVTTVAL